MDTAAARNQSDNRQGMVTFADVIQNLRLSVVCVCTLFVGCATDDPRTICDTAMAPKWSYQSAPPENAPALEGMLPHPPYKANDGSTVHSINRVWYRRGDDLATCTLPRHARDDCSVVTTVLTRSGSSWTKVGDYPIICD